MNNGSPTDKLCPVDNSPIPFDKRDGWIWMDGKIVPWKEATIHVLNHGLHYASSVFEGLRVYNGKIFKLQEHSERLIRSGKLLGFDVPYTAEELNEATKLIVEKQGIVDGYVRPVAWRGSEQMAILTTLTSVHVAIATWQWPAYYTDESKRKGAKLTWAEWKRPSPETIPTEAKAAGLYMTGTLSKNAAFAKGFQEAMMLDWRGFVAETTSSNVFFVRDGELHTPAPEGFLNGITRQTVIQLAKDAGITVHERHIKPEELEGMSEAFMTGSAAELTPIGSLDDLSFEVGSVTETLMEAYKKITGAS